jgi:hypothetical protein
MLADPLGVGQRLHYDSWFVNYIINNKRGLNMIKYDINDDLGWIATCVFELQDDNVMDLLYDVNDTADILKAHFPYWELILLGMFDDFYRPDMVDVEDCNKAMDGLRSFMEDKA